MTDTGKGISESNQAAIFRRFYREEEVHDQQGVGIGLYLAREIVTRQGDISRSFQSWARLRIFYYASCKVRYNHFLKCPSVVTFHPDFDKNFSISDICVTLWFTMALSTDRKP